MVIVKSIWAVESIFWAAESTILKVHKFPNPKAQFYFCNPKHKSVAVKAR
jgi:hypothetical protein